MKQARLRQRCPLIRASKRYAGPLVAHKFGLEYRRGEIFGTSIGWPLMRNPYWKPLK